MDRSGTGTDRAVVQVEDLTFEMLITAEELAREVARMAAAIDRRHAGGVPVMLCVLNGGAIFHADLVRRMTIPLEVDYLRVASYHGGVAPRDTPTFTAPPGTSLAGRDVILVEDIVDTGQTLGMLRRWLLAEGVARLEVAALLHKTGSGSNLLPPEHVGFTIANHFVVGYGLDYRGLGRNLPAIYRLLPTTTPADP